MQRSNTFSTSDKSEMGLQYIAVDDEDVFPELDRCWIKIIFTPCATT